MLHLARRYMMECNGMRTLRDLVSALIEYWQSTGATVASLALGRFVFLPFQRANAKKQVLSSPTHFMSFACHPFISLVLPHEDGLR